MKVRVPRLITRGLVEALGADRCTAVCVDDYHKYDRANPDLEGQRTEPLAITQLLLLYHLLDAARLTAEDAAG